MKSTYEVLAKSWEQLASAAMTTAQSLEGDETAIKNVYSQFTQDESALFSNHGWTYEEFKAETLRKAGGP